jgi:biotin synthase
LIKKLFEKVLQNIAINKEEAIYLINSDSEELYYYANKIKNYFCDDKVDLCSIINAKSGNCTENCKYCAQSAKYKTNIKIFPMIKHEKILSEAKKIEKNNIKKFSIVISGKTPSNKDFKDILKIYTKLKKETNLELCGSLGLLTYEMALELKKIGISTLHNNLETSKEYFSKICTTHTYEDKINTIKNIQKANIKVCSGGIIGIGESITDRINLAFELKKLNIKSIPINILIPIKGTPLNNIKILSKKEILNTISTFRFINPKSNIRFAGGRQLLSDNGKKGLLSGANAILTGNYLTTTGSNITKDINMIKECELKI